MTANPTAEWKRGLPPGAFTPDMLWQFEVYFSPGGMKWYRRRSPEDAAAMKARITEGVACYAE